MKKQFLEIAKIVATQGVRGEVRCQYYCDTPEVLCEFDTLYLGKDKTEVHITRSFVHKNVVVLKIEGIDSIEEARPYIGKMLFINRDDAELPEGVYFIQDIIGMEVKDADTGEIYGKISEVYQNGASDVYAFQKNGKEMLFPGIKEVVINIDTEKNEMLIRPLPGLFDDDDDTEQK